MCRGGSGVEKKRVNMWAEYFAATPRMVALLGESDKSLWEGLEKDLGATCSESQTIAFALGSGEVLQPLSFYSAESVSGSMTAYVHRDIWSDLKTLFCVLVYLSILANMKHNLKIIRS